MITLSPQDLREIYAGLPDDLQTAIFSVESMDVYDQIQARYALEPAQREELSIQSGLLMMGITEPKEYVLVLAEKLGIPRDKAAFIAQEVNRNILHGVRESLKEIHAPTQKQVATAPLPNIPTPTITPVPPPPPPTATSSPLNQKLGNTFRIPTPPQAPVPNYGAPISAPVQPPPPPTPSPTPQTPRVDPYRESPL
jgi:hypothetical protein